MDIKARNFACVNKELSQWCNSKSIVFYFNELLFHTVWPSEREDAELGLLLVEWSEMIYQMATIGVITHIISFKHLRQGAGRGLAQTGHLFLDISKPGETTPYIIGTHKTCVIRDDSYLLITSEEYFFDSGSLVPEHLWRAHELVGRNESRLLRTKLKDSQSSTVIGHCQCLFSWHHLECSQS